MSLAFPAIKMSKLFPSSMQSYVVRKSAMLSGALLFSFSLSIAACGPSDVVGNDRLKPVKEGMTKAELLPVIGTGPLSPITPLDEVRLTNGYRSQGYLVNGANYQVIWYREAAGTLQDTISRQVQTPIIIRNDTVMGWGWSFYDKKTSEYGIPNVLNDRVRIDSISKAQQGSVPKP